MKRVCLLGATGSIGRSALDVIRRLPGELMVTALAAGADWQTLRRQAKACGARRLALSDESAGRALASAVSEDARGGEPAEVLVGPEAICALAGGDDSDVVVLAIPGAAALKPAVAALGAGKTVALASKEPLIMAGGLLQDLAAASGATLIPVDSEHSAVFQSLLSGRRGEVRRIYLTASGGPFYDQPTEVLARVSPEQALKHPTWSMGPKVTIDSATLLNKGLEVIEAKWLFGLEVDQIEVVIHRQSIVHSMVEFCDGATMAQMGRPDMRLPIQFALTYPERKPGPVTPVAWTEVGDLSFERPDTTKFPGLALGYRAARTGGTMGAVLNAADEIAVEAFLDHRIGFLEIPQVIEQTMNRHQVVEQPDWSAIDQADAWARQEAVACLS